MMYKVLGIHSGETWTVTDDCDKVVITTHKKAHKLASDLNKNVQHCSTYYFVIYAAI